MVSPLRSASPSPLDPGTCRVVSEGMGVLFQHAPLLSRLLEVDRS